MSLRTVLSRGFWLRLGWLVWYCQSVASLSPPSRSSSAATTVEVSKIRAISFDVTGTLLATREPVVKSYHDAAVWARLPDPPSQEQLKRGFKLAFKERSIESPCFGGVEGISGRDWWQQTIRRVLHYAALDDDNKNKDKKQQQSYTEEEFQRYFRRVYQHFGSPVGYQVLEDAQYLLSAIEASPLSDDLVQGITSNTPIRHMESVLPMLDGFHDHFSWFTCSQEVGHEKPSPLIFEDALQKVRFWLDDPHLGPEAVLHIGDSYACDYCGAKAFGFQALLLDRTGHPSVTTYQDWMEAPDYHGKSPEDAAANTVASLEEVTTILGLEGAR